MVLQGQLDFFFFDDSRRKTFSPRSFFFPILLFVAPVLKIPFFFARRFHYLWPGLSLLQKPNFEL